MEHLFSKQNNESLWKQGYSNYSECLSDWIELTKFHLCDKTNEEKEKQSLEKATNYILSRIKNTKDAWSYPLLQLKQRFSLSTFQMHCILLGLLYEISPDMGELFATWGKGSLLPNAYAASRSFSLQKKNSYEELSKELSPEFCKIFLSVSNYKIETLWDTPLVLNFEIKTFLIPSEERKIALHDTFFPFYDLKQTELDSPIPISDTIWNLYTQASKNTIIHISGEKHSGRFFQVQYALKKQEKNVILVSAEDFYGKPDIQLEQHFFRIYRTATLQNAVPCICNMDIFLQSKEQNKILFCHQLLSFFETYFPVLFLITETKWISQNNIPDTLRLVHYETQIPSLQEQYDCWKYFSRELPCEKIDFYILTNQFHLHIGDIKHAIQKAIQLAKSENSSTITYSHFHKACLTSCSGLREMGAHFVPSSYTWDDIILSNGQKKILRHACNYIKLNHIIYEKWNYKKIFPYGNNLSILLEGPPGTGKTMTAQVLANELGLELYQLNIAQTVSKYIGETEKKLNQIFNEAERCHAILFIDEMDAFFGKRTEIKSSQDKYANMETSFLLQKIENFKGVLILATNYLKNIDEAFIRRIKFIVSFSLPDATQRYALWKNFFPKNVPLANDIDFDFLANEFELSGGNIKNIVLKSAFLAASQETKIGMNHILLSIQEELSKQGKVLLDTDFREYAYIFTTKQSLP